MTSQLNVDVIRKLRGSLMCFAYIHVIDMLSIDVCTGELGYDGLDGTRKIGPSYAKSVIYI